MGSHEIEKESGTNRSSLARRAGRALIVFAAVMLLMSYVSRAVSESLKAVVETGYTSAVSLDESVTGAGEWSVGDTQRYTTYFSRRISQVYVKIGQWIQEGDALFAYDVSTVTGGKAVSRRDLNKAEEALMRAKAAQSDASDAEYAARVVENAEQSLLYARHTYEQYLALQNGGVVRAAFSGTLTQCDAVAGKPSVAGETSLVVAPNGTAFSFAVDPERARRLQVGDEVLLLTEDGERDGTVRIERIEPVNANGFVTVRCQGDGGKARLLGSKQDYAIEKRSVRYQTCVPLSALRQSGPDAYYVLVLTTKDTILGASLVVRARDVTLLAQDDRYAAIEGGVGGEEKLVTASSKELRDGDYVALKEE